MTTALSLILALMLSIGGSPSGVPGNTGIQAPIDNSCTINRIFEDYSQKTASRLFPKKIPEIVLIDQPKTQIRLIFTLPLKEKPLLMGYEDSMNLYQAFNMNPINFTDPFGKDVLGSCAESYKYYLNPTENEETIEAHKRALALVGEGAANAAVKTFLFPAKYITLPARLLFGFDFDVSLNFTEEGSVVNAGIGKQNRLDIVKAQTVVYPLADYVSQTGQDVYFGLFYQGGNSSLGKSSRENLARSAGSLEFNTLFWGNVSRSIIKEPNIVQSGPGSAAHKAQRWAEYQQIEGKWSYERWSKQYDINMNNVKNGLSREALYREALGGENRIIKTPFGKRQIDSFVSDEGLITQIKTGYEYLTTKGRLANTLAIMRDSWLAQRGYIVEWVLEKGGSAPLLKALENSGIKYIIGPLF